MAVFLFALLLLSLGMAIVLLTSVTYRYRGRMDGPAIRRYLGGGQLVVGALWVLWGVLYLSGGGSAGGRGWYAVALGALWVAQGIRRLR